MDNKIFAMSEKPSEGNSFEHDESLPRSMSSTGCSLVAEMDRALESPCVILVPRVTQLRPGSQLVGPVRLGRLLGAGLQARVHELTLQDGTPTGKVIKIAHSDVAHKALNAVWISMEREWELGLQLRAALQDEHGKLPGFLRVCDALVSSDPDSHRASRRRARFAGMILEKLNGWEVYKRIDTPEFHNIHYVKEMLRQVFTSLDRAQCETGFFHADMGMRNIMEHYPNLYDEIAEEQKQRNLEAQAGGAALQRPPGDEEGPRYETTLGALPDGDQGGRGPRMPGAKGSSPEAEEGHHVTATPVLTPSDERNLPDHEHRIGGDFGGRVRPRPGYTCNADGSRMPLGPRVEFKIIDYGSSIFSETLAQATGGFRSRHNYDRLRRLFEAPEVSFASPTRKTLIEVETSAAPSSSDQTWHLLPTRVRQRFKLKSAPAGTEPVPMASAPPERLQSFTQQESLDVLGRFGPRERAVRATMLQSQSAGAQRAGSLPPPPPTPRMNPIEKMYRQFWRRKGDVFHLLLGMAVVLDDRVWPREDKEDVLLFVSLVHHVTGVVLKASFADENEPAVKGMWGRKGRVTRLQREKYGEKGSWAARFRRFHIRFKAHVYPFNSGLTAGEALVAPFFQDKEVVAPPQPAVDLGTLFPRWH